MSFKDAGLELFLLGETDGNLSGSEWAYIHGMRGGIAPTADLQREMRLIDLLVAGNQSALFSAAHDLSQGGLAITLIEMVLRHRVGATIKVDDPGIALLSETPGRVVVAVKKDKVSDLQSLASKFDIALAQLGTTGGDALVINDASISLDELHLAHTDTFKKLFG
jgi:phosphoribosylformylglycinamidine synthase